MKINGQLCYLWAVIDVDNSGIYFEGEQEFPTRLSVLESCEGKPIIVVDSGPWYRWALERLERWFRELKDRTKRLYNNSNAKSLKSIEEIVTAIARIHNLTPKLG
ncbi:MAG: hypothetical protein QXN23_07595 [Candidatus Caldarchaeum sp.]|jgi:transposase-like protein